MCGRWRLVMLRTSIMVGWNHCSEVVSAESRSIHSHRYDNTILKIKSIRCKQQMHHILSLLGSNDNTQWPRGLRSSCLKLTPKVFRSYVAPSMSVFRVLSHISSLNLKHGRVMAWHRSLDKFATETREKQIYEKKFQFWLNSLLQSEDQYGVSPSHRRVETTTQLVLDIFYDVSETVWDTFCPSSSTTE